MKNLYIINFYREKKEEKIKKYEKFISQIWRKNFKIKIIKEGDKIKDCDGIILSGSQKMVGDGEIDLNYLNYIFSFKKPVLGICYGHQALSKFFGAKIIKSKRKHEGFEEIFLLEKSRIFNGLPEKFKMYESHEEEVLATEEFLNNFKIIAKNIEEGIEAIECKNFPFFGVQFHPEESLENGAFIFKNFLDLI